MGLWSNLHLYTLVPTFIVLAALAGLIAFLMRNKSDKAKNIPFMIVAAFIVLFEIAKQAESLIVGYDVYKLPFHYCSIFLYTLPLHAFYRGKHKETVDIINFSTGASLFFFMLIMPTVVYGENDIAEFFVTFNAFHTVVFHAVVCFYFFLTVAMAMPKLNTKRDLKIISIFLTCYVALATALSYIFDTNFHNLLRCNLGAAENIRLAMVEAMGGFGQAIYTFVIYVLTILFVSAGYFFIRAVLFAARRITEKIKSKKA